MTSLKEIHEFEQQELREGRQLTRSRADYWDAAHARTIRMRRSLTAQIRETEK